MIAKFSSLSNRHACEPKIVSELLFPVNVIITFMGNILNAFSKKNLLIINQYQKSLKK